MLRCGAPVRVGQTHGYTAYNQSINQVAVPDARACSRGRPHKRIFDTPICPLPSGPSPVLSCRSIPQGHLTILFVGSPCLLWPGIVPSMLSFSSEVWREMLPKYLLQGGYVMTGVCLPVCLFLLATLRKNY